MGPRWLAVLGCVCALVALGHAAAVGSTTETLVVAKTEDDATTASPVEESTDTPVQKTDEGPTTDEPNAPIKLTEMDVKSEVSMRYAYTAVVTKVRNPAKKAQEATFRVLLPDTAFISGFTMTLDGKSYKAYVKEKEEAKQIYSDAVSQGIGAAHIATKARDSNHFTVSVNVEPNSLAIFNLTYEELLERRNKVYNHAINLHPGVVVPKLTVTVHIKEDTKITALRVPEVRTGNEIDATENDAQNSKAVIDRGHDDREATVTFTPDIEEQRRLMDVYNEKSKESQAAARHNWYQTEAPAAAAGVLGQFVVQYDVDRSKTGDILVNNGYFVHFFAPEELPPLAKHVVFVLDTSGSMMDRKIAQLREAMQTILSELNPRDYFSIVEFASSVKVYDLKEADEPAQPTSNNYFWHEERPLTLVPPAPATPDNIAKAKVIVSRLSANGGTNINSALNTAIELIQKGIGWSESAPAAPAATTPASNDAPAAEPATEPAHEARTAADTQVDTANKEKDEKKLEPIIIFLTDGDPTVGETDPIRIINRITEKNYGVNRAALYSLAFGEDADRKFLRKLSLRNDGFMRHIYEAADAALQLRDFYRQVASPLLAHVHFTYPADQIKEGSVTKNKFRTINAGSEVVVAGRVREEAAELAPHVYGVCGVDDTFLRKKYEVYPRGVKRTNSYLPLERLWAYLTIKQLLDERDAAETADKKIDDKENKEDTPEKKALSIALQYEFVTPLTSLVVVKPNDTKAVDAESVHKQENGSPLALNSGFASSYISGTPGSAAGAPLFAYKQRNPRSMGTRKYSKGTAFSSAIGHVPAHSPLGGIALDSLPQYEEAAEPDDHYSDGIVFSTLKSDSASLPNTDVVDLRIKSPSFEAQGLDDRSTFGVPFSPVIGHVPPPLMALRRATTTKTTSKIGPSFQLRRGGGASSLSYRSSYRPTLGGFSGSRIVGGHYAPMIAMSRPSYFTLPRDSLFRFDADEDDLDYDFVSGPSTPYLPAPGYAHPVPPSTLPPLPAATSTTAAPSNALAVYHLENFTWVKDLLKPDSDVIQIQKANDTSIDLELTKDADAPKETSGDASCARATDGAAGVCVYLTRCDAARTISADDYKQAYCQVNNRFAGVCCPTAKVDVPKAA